MNKIKLLIISCIFFALIGYWFNSSPYEIKNAVPKNGGSIVCFGDSLTYGIGAGEGMDYPSQLSAMIARDIINAGKSGDTTASALKRLDVVLNKNPGIVLITLGGNDLKNGIKKKRAFQNLELIIGKIQDSGALVILGGIDIPFFGKGFGEAYETVAEKTGAVLVPNVFEGIMGNPDLMSDNIHPNGEGYTKMALLFYDSIAPFLRAN